MKKIEIPPNMINDGYLIRSISKFVDENKRMPNSIHGKFDHLMALSAISRYVERDGFPFYSTPAGLIKIELDMTADALYIT